MILGSFIPFILILDNPVGLTLIFTIWNYGDETPENRVLGEPLVTE